MSSPGGGQPDFLIASNYAPANVKARADAICPGSNDDLYIQDIISSCATAPPYTRDGQDDTNGKLVNFRLSTQEFSFGGPLSFPAASIVSFRGAGTSNWFAIGAISSTYNGGTLIYSTNPGGTIISAPKNINNYPNLGINWQDMDVIIQNPASVTSNPCVDMKGFVTGTINNINILCDISVHSVHNIATGLDLNVGGFSAHKSVSNINICNFRSNGVILNTTHIDAKLICCSNISGDTNAASFSITGNEDNKFSGLHAFSGTLGLSSNFSYYPLVIDNMHFEAMTTPIRLQNPGTTTPPFSKTYIREACLDGGTPWSGDITDPTKCSIETVVQKRTVAPTGPAFLTSNFGIVTIPAGSTSAVFNPGLFASPNQTAATPLDTFGLGYWISPGATATAVTVNIPAILVNPATFEVSARV